MASREREREIFLFWDLSKGQRKTEKKERFERQIERKESRG